MDDEIPDIITLEAEIQNALTFEIDIPIDKQKFNALRQTYHLNKAITFDSNNDIVVQQLTIRPTLIELDIAYHNNNPLKIFSIKNLKVVDGNDEEWDYHRNGMFFTPIDDDTTRYFLESPYFNYPKELYLQGDGVYGLSKEHLDVVVNLESEEILRGPDSIQLEAITNQGAHYKLHFVTPTYNESMQYTIFNDLFKDGNGKEFRATSNVSSPRSHAGYNEYFYYIPQSILMDNIIIINLVHYPNLIDEPFRVKIK